MNETAKKIILMSFGVIVAVVAISGGTYAYFNASVQANNSVIHQSSYALSASLNVTAVRSGNLVPTADNLIMTSLNGSYPCEDARGYSLCSLYQASMSNTGSALQLNGYIRTNSGTTFTTSDLKYRLLTKSGNTYTAASDIGVINVTANSKNYFKSSNANIDFTLPANGSLQYYVVIWLSDDNSNQLDTVNKTYNGTIAFETQDGGVAAADFTS